MTDKPKPQGSIITFYSYKGGTGRSMALANMAWVLASNGKKVLMVDWDLEAPGLHRYFHPFLSDRSLAASDGVIDFIIDYAAEAMTPGGNQAEDWYLAHANILRYAVSLNHQFRGGGTLDFVPAGRQDSSYSIKVNAFNWQNFYDRLGGGSFLEAAKQRMVREYDFVLIDSRTGVSDTSGVCTVQMPDLLVVCFTLNDQSIDGAATVAQSVSNQRRGVIGSPNIKIFPVPTRVERAEKDRVELARLVARERFDDLLGHLKPASRDAYWGHVEIQYEPFYAFEEVLATIRDTPRLTSSMLGSIERLTSYVTGGAITEVVPLVEAERLRLLAEYTRKAPARKLSSRQNIVFFVSYAIRDSDDLMTSFLDDLIAEVSSRSGLQAGEIGWHDRRLADVSGAWTEELRSALERSRFLVPLFSPAYFASETCAKEFEVFRLRQLGRETPLIFPVSWIPSASYPAAVSPFQLLSTDLAEAYRNEGLRFILRLRERQGDYYRFLSRFADLLVNHLHGVEPTPVSVPPFHELQNPFAVAADASARISPSRLHNLPYRSLGELFVGRERELAAIEADLAAAAQGGLVLKTIVLHGLGGCGKTRLAVEYAWRYGSRFHAALFIRAESAARLWSQVAALGRGDLLAMSRRPQEEKEAAAAALAWLRRQPSWLLILDGVETDQVAIEVRSLLSQLPAGNVLITTRLLTWSGDVAQRPVDLLSVSEAGKFLLMRTQEQRQEGTSDPASAAILAEALGRLPLALELAGAAIAERRLTLDAYLDAWKRQQQTLTMGGPFELPLSETFHLILQALAPAAATLLRMLAYLASDPVPGVMLKAADQFMGEGLALYDQPGHRDSTPPAVQDGLAELSAYSIVRREDETVAVHALVQEFVRSQIPEEQRRGWIELTLRLVHTSLSHFSDTSAWDLMHPHVASVVRYADFAAIPEPTVQLLGWLAERLSVQGRPQEAEPLLRRALELTETVYGTDHPQYTAILRSLARLELGNNDLSHAEALLRQALEIDERSAGATAPTVARDLNDLVRVLNAMGRLSEAEPLARRAIELTEGLMPSDSLVRVSSLYNMAQVSLASGEASVAEEMFRQALALHEELFGVAHPAVATDLVNLARTLSTRGRSGDAEPLLRRAVDIDQQVFGFDHPEVAIDLRELAKVLSELNRNDEAERLLRQALSVNEAALGPDHLEVARDLHLLAQVFQSMERRNEAESLYRRALAIRERTLGADDPETRSVREHLRSLVEKSAPSTAASPQRPTPR